MGTRASFAECMMGSALHLNDKEAQFPPSWYAATAAIPPERPRLKGRTKADVCIIGAGYTGLHAALTLRERGLSVVVLEAHRAGWGASGRNGGQVGSGYNKGPIWLERHVGKAEARLLWDLCENSKALVRESVERFAPDALYKPGVAHGVQSPREFEHLKRETEHIARHYGYSQTELFAGDDFRNLVKTRLYKGGTLDHGAGHIHPLRYALGLASAAASAGAQIFERSEVHHIEQGKTLRIQTALGHVEADHLILAGNGYLPQIEKHYAARVMTVNSFIGATAPLGDTAKEVLSRDVAVYDDSNVVNYFRLSEDGRLLFGGRANYSVKFPKDMGTKLHRRMATMFPQIADIPFDYVWGGTLGVTYTRLPAVLRVAPNIVAAGGYSGQGVALAGLAGKVMAEAVAGQAQRFDTLALLPTVPLPRGQMTRVALLTLAMSWATLRDKIGL